MLSGNRVEAHLGKNHKISEQFDRKTSGSLQTHGNLLLLESQLSDKRLRTNTTSQNAGSHRNQSILSTGTYQAGPCGKTILPRCLSCSILDLAINPCVLTIWGMLLFPLSDASARASIWKREEGSGSRSGCRCSGNTLTECYFSIPSVLLSVSKGSLYHQKEWQGYQFT